MVHIVDAGWKEMKLGVVFELAQRSGRHERTGKYGLAAHAAHSSYAAHRAGPKCLANCFLPQPGGGAGSKPKTPKCLVMVRRGSGIKRGYNFGDGGQLVDWYHAKQHLTEATRLSKGEGTPAYTLWSNRCETVLYQGHAARIAAALEQATPAKPEWAEDLKREAGYFRQHQQRMNYLEMREDNGVIGSGMVEGGAKRYQARLCGPGMR